MGRIATLLLTSLLTQVTAIPKAFADVNMMEASFQSNFIDLEIGGLKILRRYNSRSNFTGVFGFGWCSTFDTRLEFSTTPQGKALAGVNECGRTVNLGAASSALHYSNGHYTQHLKTGLVRTFSSENGELESLRTEHGPEVKILRAPAAAEAGRSRLPRDAALGEGLKMRLEFDEYKEMVTSLETSNGKRTEFTYSPDRNLLSARNAWNNTYRFNYDTLHNLTSVEYPDRTSEHMIYDSDHDRLLSFQGRDHCLETYTHQFMAESPTKLQQTSTSNLVCNTRTKRQVRFNFTYEKRGGAWSLTQLSKTNTNPKSKSQTEGAQ